jgi:hypothetical protein
VPSLSFRPNLKPPSAVGGMCSWRFDGDEKMLGVIHGEKWRAQGDAIRSGGMHELVL